MAKTLLLSCVPFFAQQPISTSEILASALNAPALSLHQRELGFLKKNNHDLPLVEELELRTETDELDFGRQEYLLRLSMNSTEERIAQRRFHQQNVKIAETEQAQILHEELLERYFLLVKTHHLEQEARLRLQQKLLAEDRVAVLRRLAAAKGGPDLLGLISAEDELHSLEREILELKGDASRAAASLSLSEGASISFANLLTVNDLKNVLASLASPGGTGPEAQQRHAEVERSNAEYELELAGKKRVLDFVQMKYAGRDNLNFGEEWSFGMGFNIPLKGAERIDLNELALERIENENRLAEHQLRQQEKWAAAQQEMTQLFEKLELAQQQLADSQAAYSLKNYPQTADADPLILLKIKESQLKRQLAIADIEKDIYLTYLELLGLSGKAAERPLRNYLTAGPEKMEE